MTLFFSGISLVPRLLSRDRFFIYISHEFSLVLTFDNWRLKLVFSIRDFSFDQSLGLLFIYYLGVRTRATPRSCYLQYVQSHIRKKALLKPDTRGTGATIANPCTSVIPARDRLLVGVQLRSTFLERVFCVSGQTRHVPQLTALEPGGVPRDIADWRCGKTPLIRTHGDQAVMVVSVPAAASS